MSKLYFDTNAVVLYVRKVKAVYILILQCKKYRFFPEIGDFSLVFVLLAPKCRKIEIST